MAENRQGKVKRIKYKKMSLARKAVLGIFILLLLTVGALELIDSKLLTPLNEYIGVSSQEVAYDCEVRFIDVGQGDSSLILSDGYSVLVDGGENMIGKDVVDYLQALDIKRLDMIIATHPHSDHIGGLDVVMEAFPVKRVIMPKIKDELVPTTQTFTDFLTAVKNQDIKPEYARLGDKYAFGKGEITIFAPVGEFNDLNDSSIGFRFDYDGKASFLFTGDMEKKAEKAVIKDDAVSLRADVLKSPHHGSKTSSTKEFFELVKPQICVISVGNGNSYNLPSDDIIRRYGQGGAQIYRTDANGSIVIGYDSEGYHVMLEKASQK